MEKTALEAKWETEAAQEAEKEPTLDNAYADDGSLVVEKLEGSVKDRVPRPTGWRIVILPYRGAKKSKGGIVLSDQTIEKQQLTTVCGYVLAVGDLAYKDEGKFPNGPWCKEGDWVVFGRYAGARIGLDGGEIRILNDDEILARIDNPEDILHM
jgi:co-chaperonin GroES (HSP10)